MMHFHVLKGRAPVVGGKEVDHTIFDSIVDALREARNIASLVSSFEQKVECGAAYREFQYIFTKGGLDAPREGQKTEMETDE